VPFLSCRAQLCQAAVYIPVVFLCFLESQHPHNRRIQYLSLGRPFTVPHSQCLACRSSLLAQVHPSLALLMACCEDAGARCHLIYYGRGCSHRLQSYVRFAAERPLRQHQLWHRVLGWYCWCADMCGTAQPTEILPGAVRCDSQRRASHGVCV